MKTPEYRHAVSLHVLGLSIANTLSHNHYPIGSFFIFGIHYAQSTFSLIPWIAIKYPTCGDVGFSGPLTPDQERN